MDTETLPKRRAARLLKPAARPCCWPPRAPRGPCAPLRHWVQHLPARAHGRLEEWPHGWPREVPRRQTQCGVWKKKKNRAETDSHDSQRLHEHDGTSHNAARGIVRHITWTQNSHKLKEPPDGDMIYLPWSPLPCAAWVVAAMLSMPGARAPKAAAGRRRPEACVQTECPSPALACAAQTEYPVRVSVRIQCNTSKHMQSKGWNSSRRNYGQLHERNRPARICNALHFL